MLKKENCLKKASNDSLLKSISQPVLAKKGFII